MNREQAKELWPILEAWVAGGELQIKHSTEGWQEIDSATFSSDPSLYRIKPKGRGGFVHIDDFHTGCHGRKDCIKVREVLE